MTTQAVSADHAYGRVLSRIGWALVIHIGAFYAFDAIGYSLLELFYTWNYTVGLAVDGLISPLTYAASFILPAVLFFVMMGKEHTEPLRLDIRLPATFPLMILGGLAVITAGAYLNQWFCQLIGYNPSYYEVGYDNPYTVVSFMAVAIAPAVGEEFLFRGVIYSNLRPFGRVQAVLISSALFALMHQNLAQFIYTFLAGIAMALMYELTGSIWCSTIFHLLNNELAVLFEAMSEWYGESFYPLWTVWDLVVLLLGGVSILILYFYFRKGLRAVGAGKGFAGYGREAPELYGPAVSRATVKDKLMTPGLILFTVIALLSAVGDYLYVLLGGFGP